LNDNCVVDDEFACQKLYMWVYYVLCKIDEEWSCGYWIMSEFMIICRWSCFGACCWWIDTMGIPICELVIRIVVVVENLWKFGELLNFDEMMF